MGKLSRELRMGIHNRFDIEVVDVETGEVKQKAQAFNVVCNSYFPLITQASSSSGYLIDASYIQIGSGTGTPSATDTGLFHYEGYASDDSIYSPYDRINQSQEKDGIWIREIKRTIPNTSYVGVTLTEVGLATSNTGDNIVTHAALQDMNGNPISISHTSTDIINIYCSIYLHYAGQDGDIHLYYTGGAYGYYNSQSEKGAIIQRALLSPNGRTTSSNSYRVRLAYGAESVISYITEYKNMSYSVGNNNSLILTADQLEVTRGNMWGLGVLVACTAYQPYSGRATYEPFVAIDAGGTVFPPSSISNESVGIGDGTTTKFKTAFSYPYNATVKVNGVAVTSGVTVNKQPSDSFSHNNRLNNESYLYHMKRVYSDKPSLRWLVGGLDDLGYLTRGCAWEFAHPDIGLWGFYSGGSPLVSIKGSNDGITWHDVTFVSGSSGQIDQASAHYKYYKNVGDTDVANVYPNDYDGYNIIFDTPPAQGDVITIDYTTDYIPKDADHVLDVELTFTFGEYNPT